MANLTSKELTALEAEFMERYKGSEKHPIRTPILGTAKTIRDITPEQAQVQDLTTEGMYIMARGTVHQPIGKWAGTTM